MCKTYQKNILASGEARLPKNQQINDDERLRIYSIQFHAIQKRDALAFTVLSYRENEINFVKYFIWTRETFALKILSAFLHQWNT